MFKTACLSRSFLLKVAAPEAWASQVKVAREELAQRYGLEELVVIRALRLVVAVAAGLVILLMATLVVTHQEQCLGMALTVLHRLTLKVKVVAVMVVMLVMAAWLLYMAALVVAVD